MMKNIAGQEGESMKFSDKSLEELEGELRIDPIVLSAVVQISRNAWKKPLSALSGEEIRLLIGQGAGLKYVIPLAVEVIKDTPLAETTYFEGDLLLQLLRLSGDDWAENASELAEFKAIVRENYETISACEYIPKARLKAYLEA